MDTKTLRNIQCGFVNIQSVGNKTIELRELISEKSYDVLGIAETWLHDSDKSKIAEMTPSTHKFMHSSRNTRRGVE